MNTWMLIVIISVTTGMGYSDIEIIHTPVATEADCLKLKEETWNNTGLVAWRNKASLECVEVSSY